MDIMFGTYTCPNHEPESFGLSEKSPSTYAGQLVEPLLPNKLWKRLASSFPIKNKELKKKQVA